MACPKPTPFHFLGWYTTLSSSAWAWITRCVSLSSLPHVYTEDPIACSDEFYRTIAVRISATSAFGTCIFFLETPPKLSNSIQPSMGSAGLSLLLEV